ncbi:hypothetical protein AB4Y36_24955 [Paraburkholderia sp. BR10936]|uniref:hypothetical protein n=1 Tax=Paraburkholderia sp. BR10936 TaxID=3236993 RepID=UPI0034D1928D
MALLGIIEYSVTRAMMRETDSRLRWQLRYFDSRSDASLAGAIDARFRRPDQRDNFYGLFAPDGRRLAEDIRAMPTGLALGPRRCCARAPTRAFATVLVHGNARAYAHAIARRATR